MYNIYVYIRIIYTHSRKEYCAVCSCNVKKADVVSIANNIGRRLQCTSVDIPGNTDITNPFCICIRVQPYIFCNTSCIIQISLTLAIILYCSLCSTQFHGPI